MKWAHTDNPDAPCRATSKSWNIAKYKGNTQEMSAHGQVFVRFLKRCLLNILVLSRFLSVLAWKYMFLPSNFYVSTFNVCVLVRFLRRCWWNYLFLLWFPQRVDPEHPHCVPRTHTRTRVPRTRVLEHSAFLEHAFLEHTNTLEHAFRCNLYIYIYIYIYIYMCVYTE